jgi:putative restriction endonuclease
VRIADLEAGFDCHGERIPLINRQRGIWRPRQLGADGPALSITTAPPRPGKTPPYDDQVGSEERWFAYRYEKDDPDTWTNRAVRRAMELQRPLIYFYGVEPGLYEPIYPAYVVEDDPASLTFRVSPDAMAGLALDTLVSGADLAARRAYETREVKVRLHQRRFRELVMRAYQTRCAVCRIRHNPLLDAAHILPDRDERGRPEVPNGLALCKIHHAAFDAHILGVAPDRVIHIRHDILEEHDGPMLLYGIQRMDRQPLNVPRNPLLQPNDNYLAERFERFRAA